MASAQLVGPCADLCERLAVTIIEQQSFEPGVELQAREMREHSRYRSGSKLVQLAAKYIDAGAAADQRNLRTFMAAQGGRVHGDRIPNHLDPGVRESALTEETFRRVRAVDLERFTLTRIPLDEPEIV